MLANRKMRKAGFELISETETCSYWIKNTEEWHYTVKFLKDASKNWYFIGTKTPSPKDDSHFFEFNKKEHAACIKKIKELKRQKSFIKKVEENE